MEMLELESDWSSSLLSEPLELLSWSVGFLAGERGKRMVLLASLLVTVSLGLDPGLPRPREAGFGLPAVTWWSGLLLTVRPGEAVWDNELITRGETCLTADVLTVSREGEGLLILFLMDLGVLSFFPFFRLGVGPGLLPLSLLIRPALAFILLPDTVVVVKTCLAESFRRGGVLFGRRSLS